jgi:hypothetical protein
MADPKRGPDCTAPSRVPTEGVPNLYGGGESAVLGELLVGPGDDIPVGTF